MKNRMKFLISSSPAFIVVLTIISLFYGCGIDVESVYEDNVVVSGKILDSKSNSSISQATVVISSYASKTKDDGSYNFIVRRINEISKDSIKLNVSKESYAQYSKIIKKADLGLMPNIALVPTNSAVTIGVSGGKIEAATTEGISSSSINLTIPQGAVSKDTAISITSLTGSHVPGVSPQSTLGLLNAGTIICQPLGTSFIKPATIIISLPVKQIPNSKLPLLKFNQTANSWYDSGIKVTVDNTGTSASGFISDCSIYSLGIAGSLTQNSATTDTSALTQTGSTMCFTDVVTWPEGKPSNISETWIKNLIAQNIGNGTIDLENPICYDLSLNSKSLVLIKDNISLSLSLSSNSNTMQSRASSGEIRLVIQQQRAKNGVVNTSTHQGGNGE